MKLYELLEKLSKIEDKDAYITIRSSRADEDCTLWEVEIITKRNYKGKDISEVHLIG